MRTARPAECTNNAKVTDVLTPPKAGFCAIHAAHLSRMPKFNAGHASIRT
jgi:hypothetical protein